METVITNKSDLERYVGRRIIYRQAIDSDIAKAKAEGIVGLALEGRLIKAPGYEDQYVILDGLQGTLITLVETVNVQGSNIESTVTTTIEVVND